MNCELKIALVEKEGFDSVPKKVEGASIGVSRSGKIDGTKTKEDRQLRDLWRSENDVVYAKRLELKEPESIIASKMPHSWTTIRGLVVFSEEPDWVHWIDLAKERLRELYEEFGTYPNTPVLIPLYRGSRGLQPALEVVVK